MQAISGVGSVSCIGRDQAASWEGKGGLALKYAAPRFATHSAVLLMAAAMPWVVLHVPVGASPAMAGGSIPGTALAQAPFGRAVDGIGWSMSGSLGIPAPPAPPAAEKHPAIINYQAGDGDTPPALASKDGLSGNTPLRAKPQLGD